MPQWQSAEAQLGRENRAATPVRLSDRGDVSCPPKPPANLCNDLLLLRQEFQ